ncbi:MAG: site-specific integrase [Proteobacteria bacterium]|nr:site-specific integrase [Pseudomonadota bacterium]
MTNPLSKLPKLRKHKASGQAVATLLGKDYYFGPYGSKAARAAYDRLLAEYLASGRSPAFGTRPDELTIIELIAAYSQFMKRYYGTSSSSEYHRIKSVLTVMKRLYGKTPAAEFGALQLKAVREMLIATKVTRGYINAQCHRVRRMFRWAVGEGLLGEERGAAILQVLAAVGPLKAGRTEAREAEPVEPVSSQLLEATLPHCTPVLADLIRFQLLTGCRPGEAIQVTPRMVDRSGDVWTIKLDKHKTAHRGKQRVLYCGPQAQAILAKYLLRGPDDVCFSPAESEAQRRQARTEARKTPPSCGNRPGTNRVRKPRRKPGKAFTTGTYGNAIRYACKRAGVETWSPNQLRHKAATEIRKQFGLDAASVMLGHSDLAITQVYAEADTEKALSVARKIG